MKKIISSWIANGVYDADVDYFLADYAELVRGHVFHLVCGENGLTVERLPKDQDDPLAALAPRGGRQD